MRVMTIVASSLLITCVVNAAAAGQKSPDAIGRSILRCYRPTATFERAIAISEVDVEDRSRFGRSPEPKSRRALIERHGEAEITFLRLYWRGGITASAHITDVAILMRRALSGAQYRTEILADSGIVPVIPAVCRSAREWVSEPTR